MYRTLFTNTLSSSVIVVDAMSDDKDMKNTLLSLSFYLGRHVFNQMHLTAHCLKTVGFQLTGSNLESFDLFQADDD